MQVRSSLLVESIDVSSPALNAAHAKAGGEFPPPRATRRGRRTCVGPAAVGQEAMRWVKIRTRLGQIEHDCERLYDGDRLLGWIQLIGAHWCVYDGECYVAVCTERVRAAAILWELKTRRA